MSDAAGNRSGNGNPREAVVLVHGLWMRPWTMQALARALKQAGYRVYVFGYPTVRRDLGSVVRQLAAFVNSRPEEVVHLVAHSMGVIAGVWPWGIGKLVNRFSGPNDGTVGLEETQADWLKHHITVNTNHLGLLKNHEVQRQVVHFLRQGHFFGEASVSTDSALSRSSPARPENA